MKKVKHFGPARGGVRVFEDKAQAIVEVRYAGRKKKRWPLTPAGKAEAIAWAKGFTEPGEEVAGEVVTVRELGRRYLEYAAVRWRPTTRRLFEARWRPFEIHAGHDKNAAAVTAETLDTLAAKLRTRDEPMAINQISHVIATVRRVYRWADSRDVVSVPKVIKYALERGRDERKNDIAEYSRVEYEALLDVLATQKDADWRVWAVLLLVGHQGVRINAALNLKWSDIRDGRLWWPPETDKMGKAWSQPIRYGALAALETARYWRELKGYTGPFVFFGTKGGAKPYTFGAAWIRLRQAETAAEVEHRDWRGFHGFRRMVAGDVWQETGDPLLAINFIGDADPSLIKEYLKRREDRLNDVAQKLDEVERNVTATSPDPDSPQGSRKRLRQVLANSVLTKADKEPPVGIEPTTAPIESLSISRETSQDAPQTRKSHGLEGSESARTPSESVTGTSLRDGGCTVNTSAGVLVTPSSEAERMK